MTLILKLRTSALFIITFNGLFSILPLFFAYHFDFELCAALTSSLSRFNYMFILAKFTLM